MIKKITVILLLVAATITIVFLLNSSKPTAKKKSQNNEKIWQVASVPIIKDLHAITLSGIGQVEARQLVTLNSQIRGEVTQLAQPGNTVAQGDILIQIKAPRLELQHAQQKSQQQQYQQQYAQWQQEKKQLSAQVAAENEILLLQQKALKREQQLKQKKLTAANTLDTLRINIAQQKSRLLDKQRQQTQLTAQLEQQQSLLDGIQATIDQIELDLSDRILTAPFDGTVIDVMTTKNSHVMPNQAVLTLLNPKSLEIRWPIAKRYMTDIQQALNNNIIISGHLTQDNSQTLTVSRIQQQATNGFASSLYLTPAYTEQLALAQFISISIDIPLTKPSIKIPKTALYPNNQVFLLNPTNESNIYRLQSIIVDIIGQFKQDDAWYYLIDSDQLSADQYVLSSRLPMARSDLKVKVTPP